VSAAYTIRSFETIEEYRDCVALQEETWGQGFSERVSPAILKVSQILGGIAAGAYDADGVLTGFVFGMTGLREGELVHWSDMLAVRPGARDRGLGTRLKAYQRDQLLGSGVEKMFWTFDPLQSRNAYVNFNKLGIVVREYAEDMYGQTDSPLHRGIGTDRFVALWLLDSDRVAGRLSDAMSGDRSTGDERGAAPAATNIPVALDAGHEGAYPHPGEPVFSIGSDDVAVRIPSDIVSLMEEDMELAVAWRAATRVAFTHYLGEGYEVREFVRGDRVSTYVVTRGRA